MVEPRRSRYPLDDFATVAAPSLQGKSDLKAVTTSRSLSKKRFAIGPSYGEESIKVLKGVPVLMKKPLPGRRTQQGPLIESGHAGQKYDEDDTQYSLKEGYILVGVPEANSSRTDGAEPITVNSGAGSMTVYATHPVQHGDFITWLPPPVNTPDQNESIQDTRAAFAKLGARGYIPTNLVPVTPDLRTDAMGRMFQRAAELFNNAGTSQQVDLALMNLQGSPDTINRAVYQGLYVSASNVRSLLGAGIGTVELIVAMNGGMLELHGARDLARFLDPRRVVAYNQAWLKESRNAFTSQINAYSSLQEAVRPIAKVLDAAGRGDTMRIVLMN